MDQSQWIDTHADGHVEIDGRPIPVVTANTVVVGTGAAGYWPLGYHSGSVWAHDTAIAAHGMHRAGLTSHALRIVAQLLDAAAAFDYRVPELYAGDSADLRPMPAP